MACAVWLARASRRRRCWEGRDGSSGRNCTPNTAATPWMVLRGRYRPCASARVLVPRPAGAPCCQTHIATSCSWSVSSKVSAPGPGLSDCDSSGTSTVIWRSKAYLKCLTTAWATSCISAAAARSRLSSYKANVSVARVWAACACLCARAARLLMTTPTTSRPAKVSRYSALATMKV